MLSVGLSESSFLQTAIEESATRDTSTVNTSPQETCLQLRVSPGLENVTHFLCRPHPVLAVRAASEYLSYLAVIISFAAIDTEPCSHAINPFRQVRAIDISIFTEPW